MRILLVEDDPKNVELFQAALEDEHDVLVERDGVAGQQRALAEAFDLILLDIQLPMRNGIEVCRNLRAGGVRTPIVALSASVLPDEVARIQDGKLRSIFIGSCGAEVLPRPPIEDRR